MTDIGPILTAQNPWWADHNHRETRVFRHRRQLYQRVREYAGPEPAGRALVLLGPRQVGKTTLLRQLADELLDGGWPPANITFFDFSDERLVESVSPRDIVATEPMGYAPDHPRVFLLDEIHEVPKWQAWLKIAVDESRRRTGGKVRYIVTGSSAESLHRGTVESGQGRWDELVLDGLSLAEFLVLRAPPGDDARSLVQREPDVFQEYLATGGFPEHVGARSLQSARARIREDVCDRAILRDLRNSRADTEQIRRLFVFLVQSSGDAWHVANRARDMDVDRKSLAGWLTYLEYTRLIVRLDAYFPSKARAHRRLRAIPKLFTCDHGLIPAFSPQKEPLDDPDVRARVFEAVVFRHLRELARSRERSVSFARIDDDLEIDFIVPRDDGEAVGVEVTSSFDVRSRKLGRTRETAKQLRLARRFLVYGGFTRQRVGETDVLPLYDFLSAPEQVLESGT